MCIGVCVYKCVWGSCVYHRACVWRSKDNLVISFLLLPCGFQDGAQMVRCVGKCPPSHITDSHLGYSLWVSINFNNLRNNNLKT